MTLDIDLECCRLRQRRVLDLMQRERIDLVVVASIEHVQWLTGPRFGWTTEPAAALGSDGRVVLVAPSEAPAAAAADEVVTYAHNRIGTLRNDQRKASSAALVDALSRRPKSRRTGVEFSRFGRHFSTAAAELGELVDVEPKLFEFRRRKDRDELARIQKAIAGTVAMYARAREIIEPGISELEVFSQLQAAAVREFGEMPTGTGNDYQCGTPGGPPRDRRAQAGELYILDLGPAFRGYFADNCRTISVDRRPTDAQQRAWEHLMQVFPLVERTVKPGLSCRELYHTVKAHCDRHLPGSFWHHLGHGIGLFPHEAPHLNPNWDDVFQEREVFTVEPGLYSAELRGGMRLENDYLVTADGVELLSEIPLEL